MNIRIIPKLDIKGPNLVKGINLEGLRVIGNPEKFSEEYYKMGADEIFYQDVVASLYDRNSMLSLINKVSKKIFIPITISGGIKTLKDIREALQAGADKVSLNSAAINNPKLINDAANAYGSSTIVITMEVIKNYQNKYYILIKSGREETGIELHKWVDEVQNRGAGEINIVSIVNEGLGNGLDLNLIKSLQDIVKIPLVINGGLGKLNHLDFLKEKINISGISIASSLHYNLISQDYFKFDNKNEGNTEFLKNNGIINKFNKLSIREIKKYITQLGRNTRLDEI